MDGASESPGLVLDNHKEENQFSYHVCHVIETVGIMGTLVLLLRARRYPCNRARGIGEERASMEIRPMRPRTSRGHNTIDTLVRVACDENRGGGGGGRPDGYP